MHAERSSGECSIWAVILCGECSVHTDCIISCVVHVLCDRISRVGNVLCLLIFRVGHVLYILISCMGDVLYRLF